MGNPQSRVIGQSGQTAHLSLNLPYSTFGLGRTNNYIDSLFVGDTVVGGREKRIRSFSGMIPNSQIIIIPYSPGLVNTDSWQLELYVNPSQYAVWVMLVLILVMVLLAGVVGVLHWFEKREDEREKRQALHSINFDAL